jgi:type IV pilus modification protein PilV
MKRVLGLHRNATGFSLLEVLIAVVVLSVGLLALAALQGAMTRSSSEAKIRGRVAAMLTARMDDLRTNGYGNMTVGTTTVTTTTDPCGDADVTDWIDCARDQAALGSLTVQQVVTVWFGAASFASSNAEQDPAIPQFKRIVLSSTWMDAGGVTHTQSIASDVSSMALTNNMIIPPEPLATPTGGPIVRTISPATAGVIPIAISTNAGEDTFNATTNPTPELVGQTNNQQIVGTRFSVLNYTPSTFGNSAVVIQKRFDTEVVKCRCKFGAGGNNLPEIYRTEMWPAVWTGEGYEVYDAGGVAAPGDTLDSGPAPGVEQSALCQECCRDHHDSGATNVARFDPERTSGTTKYDVNPQGALVQVSDMGNGDYVDSCRVVRVDGFWRTSSDIYERQHGLLPTQSVSGVEAKSGLPTAAAVQDYETFVKQYLAQIDGSQPYVAGGQAMFDAVTSLNANAINITSASNTDYRYLHARGLYVDYLEQEAIDKLVEVLDNDDPQGLCPDGEEDECLLPFLPFTTVNLTEITEWLEWPTTQTQIFVNERNLLSTTPAQPSGGRTIGIAAGTSDARTQMRRSSSGIALSTTLTTVQGVDPEDNGEVLSGTYDYSDQLLHDDQGFQVGQGGGPTFNVQVQGGGGNPFVFFSIGTDDNVECLKPSGTQHTCATSTGTVLPAAGSVTVSRYWTLTTTSETMTGQPCTPRAATAVVARPTFTDFVVTAATSNGVAGSIAPPINDISKDETTTISFDSIAQGGLVLITLTQVGDPIKATIASCTTNGNGTQIRNIVWNESWAQP